MNTPLPLELIAAVYQRQQAKYPAAHDDQHKSCEILAAAANDLHERTPAKTRPAKAD